MHEQMQSCRRPTLGLGSPRWAARTDEVCELGVLGVAGDAVQLPQLDEVQLLQRQGQLRSTRTKGVPLCRLRRASVTGTAPIIRVR